MRGGGRGRGGRGAWNRGGEDGPTRARSGPINTEPPLYPPNPTLSAAAPLSALDRRMVALNRLFVGYLQFQDKEFLLNEGANVVQDTRKPDETLCFRDLSDQKAKIVSHTGPHYFPHELLQNVYVRPARRFAKPMKRKRDDEKDKKESSEKDGADAGKKPEEEEYVVEEEDFGGDDYAHDYYGDEDIDDLDDGPDEDVL